MLSKKFYDILTLLVLFLVIGIFIGNSFLMFKWVNEPLSNPFENEESIINEPDQTLKLINKLNIIFKILPFIYWIFIMVLAVQLYSRKKTSMLDVVLIVILFPLAIIFYFVTLRGKLKQVERENNTV